MRKMMSAVAAGAVVMMLATTGFAKPATVKGQVVDEGCGLKEMSEHKGGQHEPSAAMAECMLDCAKKGEPLALVTADGKVYRITGGLAANKNAKLIAFMNKTVEITGEIGQEDGKVTIASDSIKAAK